MTIGKPEFFWSPPPGEAIIKLAVYEDMIVIATSCGIYIAKPLHRILDDYTVHKVSTTIVKLSE